MSYRPHRLVPIDNPIHGKTYTSLKRALAFVRNDRAIFLDNGSLHFFNSSSVIERLERRREAQLLNDYRSGIVHWNGSHTRGNPTHKPGERRS